MNLKSFKYIAPITVYLIALKSFFMIGIVIWFPVIYAFGIIPLIEIVIKPNHENLSQLEEDIAKSNIWYDYMLYLIVPLQYIAIYLFLTGFSQSNLAWIDKIGRIASMGVLCGTFGINVGHELGHRLNKWEQIMAKVLLLSSLYMHFFIEHNKGHHKNVATPRDPATAKINEPVYLFYFRTIWFSYLSAWNIANESVRKKGGTAFTLKNEMLQFHLVQLTFLLVIMFKFGFLIMTYFMASATIGILMLETVNYIEHYGLQRTLLQSGNYERTLPQHSWNSDHVLGRILLFELSRHSDHHFMASRKYQILKSHLDAPQLPTGYPGSMLLSLIPPLWFAIMNKKIMEADFV